MSETLSPETGPWWRDVNRYQWLVLAIASAGWVFDVFEGQIFNLTRTQMLRDIMGADATPEAISQWGEYFLGIFLLGGTIGGVFFGWLGDRWGRSPTMIVTILMYSVFSGLTYFATELWHVGVLRFLVSMGVGGEWAVAATLVAEVFPSRARANAAGIFHSSSVLGTWMAAIAAILVGTEWRLAYLVGIVPALLVVVVRIYISEPDSWKQARALEKTGQGVKAGSFKDLLFNPKWSSRAFLGMLFAGMGLGAFWGVTIAGQDLARELLLRNGWSPAEAAEKAKFAYGIVQAAGAGLGLLSFGPVCSRIGRKRAFIYFQAAAFVIVPVTCYGPQTYGTLLLFLPVFGFLTAAMQAGFAVYFPELFPNHLRSTGTAFCFNGGRIVAAGIMLLSGWLKSIPGMDLRLAVSLLGLTFVVGIVIVNFLPETKDQNLPT